MDFSVTPVVLQLLGGVALMPCFVLGISAGFAGGSKTVLAPVELVVGLGLFAFCADPHAQILPESGELVGGVVVGASTNQNHAAS